MNKNQHMAMGRLRARSDRMLPPFEILAPPGTAYVIEHVLRRAILDAPSRNDADSAQSICEWAESDAGFMFAADSVREDLASGSTRAIALNGANGKSENIKEEFWRGTEGYEAIRTGKLDKEAWISATGTYLNNPFSEFRDQSGYIFVVDQPEAFASRSIPATTNANIQTLPIKLGRPESIPREELLEHVCFCLLVEDLPSTQADFFKMILTRYSVQGIREPSNETLRKKLGPLFYELQKAQKRD